MYEIRTCRTAPADDFSHTHIDLVGVFSPHIAYEPIMVDVPRLQQRMDWGEEFYVLHEGEKVPVKPGTCEVCGLEPYLKTEKDPPDGNLILALPPS